MMLRALKVLVGIQFALVVLISALAVPLRGKYVQVGVSFDYFPGGIHNFSFGKPPSPQLKVKTERQRAGIEAARGGALADGARRAVPSQGLGSRSRRKLSGSYANGLARGIPSRR
jgi:hypothetical protein